MYPCVWTAGATLVVVVMAAGVFVAEVWLGFVRKLKQVKFTMECAEYV